MNTDPKKRKVFPRTKTPQTKTRAEAISMTIAALHDKCIDAQRALREATRRYDTALIAAFHAAPTRTLLTLEDMPDSFKRKLYDRMIDTQTQVDKAMESTSRTSDRDRKPRGYSHETEPRTERDGEE